MKQVLLALVIALLVVFGGEANLENLSYDKFQVSGLSFKAPGVITHMNNE